MLGWSRHQPGLTPSVDAGDHSAHGGREDQRREQEREAHVGVSFTFRADHDFLQMRGYRRPRVSRRYLSVVGISRPGHVEAEVTDLAVLDDVVLAFEPQLTPGAKVGK